jgi:hypothetical protein
MLTRGQAAAQASSVRRASKTDEFVDPFAPPGAQSVAAPSTPAPPPAPAAPAAATDPFADTNFAPKPAADDGFGDIGAADPFAAATEHAFSVDSPTEGGKAFDPFATGPAEGAAAEQNQSFTVDSPVPGAGDDVYDSDDSNNSEEWVDETAKANIAAGEAIFGQVQAMSQPKAVFKPYEVEVARGAQGLGLVLDHRGQPPTHELWVDEIIPGGPGDVTGKITVGDMILSINGGEVATMSMSQCVIKMSGQSVKFTMRTESSNPGFLAQARRESSAKQTFDARKYSNVAPPPATFKLPNKVSRLTV